MQNNNMSLLNSITFLHPKKLVFGTGCFRQFIDDFLNSGNRRLFILSIAPLRERIEQEISVLIENGITVKVDDNIQQEPTFADLNEIIKGARDFEADSVVGIGGGSVMDTAKLLAAMLKNDQTVEDVIGIGNLKQRKTYLACLPTTAGTGSEVSPNAIFLDENSKEKLGVISPFLVPDAAYIDPELTYGVPAAVTAATGIDALTHCLEAYVNNFSHPMVDVLALEGIRLIAENLVCAVSDGSNKVARAAVAMGSLYGGMCLGPVNTGAIHALSYPLGSKFKIAHGLANALLMPYVIEFNIEAAPQKYARVAKVMGALTKETNKDNSVNLVFLLQKLCTDCGLPTKLSEIGIPETEIDNLATDALKVQRLLKNNVRIVTHADAVEIYKRAF